MAPKSKVNPELDEVLARPENLYCADCGAKAPRWASVNLGILMCIDCSGAHRNLGTHISVVKSTTLDKWQPKWIDTVTKIGNKTGNAYYEYNLQKSQKLREGEDGQKVATWIRNKYDKKQWARRGASPSELLAKGLDPDYESDPDDSRRRDAPSRGDDRNENQSRARPRQTEDTKPKRAQRDSAPIPALQSRPTAAAKPSVDLLGEDFSSPPATGGAAGTAPAQANLAMQDPSPATAAPWTAEFQQAQPPSPFGAGGFNPGAQFSQQPAQMDFQQQQQQQMLLAQQQQQQLLAQQQQMQQQGCPQQMMYAQQPPVPAEQMQSSKVDSLKNALGALYQQDTQSQATPQQSAQARLAAAPWPGQFQQGCGYGGMGPSGMHMASPQQMPQAFQQPQQPMWPQQQPQFQQPQFQQPQFPQQMPCSAPCPQRPAMPSPAAPPQMMTSTMDNNPSMPMNQLSSLYQQALGHIADDAGRHRMQSNRQSPVAVGSASGGSSFDIDAFSAFSSK